MDQTTDSTGNESKNKALHGVMFNAYPDSIGERLADSVSMLKRPEFKDVFSLFYILPTFFNSDLDRGFSLIDYNLNRELVDPKDLKDLEALNILLKFDLVLNHLSVGSPQFQDMLKHGDSSEFKDFFINWDEFWGAHGTQGPDGYVIPKEEFLHKLFMRKPGLPILKVRFPDGSDRPYWNTFYQEIKYHPVEARDLAVVKGLSPEQAASVAALVNRTISARGDINSIDFAEYAAFRDAVLAVIEQKRTYLGQMDLNARSEKVWQFYEETFTKLKNYGATLVRLDAFAYLHKEPGMVNFFNKPETWNYLARLREMAKEHDLTLLPEIHAEYGKGLHEEVSGEGFPIYDFFFPGLVIDVVDRGTSRALKQWIEKIQSSKMVTINMLGCHDGIPVLDLKGDQDSGRTLLTEEEIENIVTRVMERGGRVKNLYGPDGRKIAYYQVNATFFSALGEDERKFLLARAIQMFMPGIPQVWYLDLFAGKNNYEAADRGGAAGHKEINRTTVTMSDVEEGLKHPIVQKQIELIRLRNTSEAFYGKLEILPSEDSALSLEWKNGDAVASLKADLKTHQFTVTSADSSGAKIVVHYN